ncbi:MAG TPA: HEAT repeat domain-containing protein [Casimicrobiaceae bacterium]
MATAASTRRPDAADPASAPAARQIRSARDLHAALNAPDPATRLGALKAVRAQPQAALAFGLLDGRDAIDLLLAQAERVRGHFHSEWLTVVGALSVFRDSRVTAFFLEVLRTATEPTLLFAVAGGLTAEPSTLLHERLRPLLLQDDCPARARAVAPVLAALPALTAAERLRIALLVEADDREPALCDAASAEHWLSELAGVFQREARAALEVQGAPAFAHLVGAWDRLSEDSRAWLVEWALRGFPTSAGSLIERALASRSDRIVLVALEGVAALPEGAIVDPSILRRFAEHSSPALRAAAIGAGAAGLDWRQQLAHDPDPAVKRACISRLVEAEGLRALPLLVVLLRDTDWQMRAVATRALTGLGEAVVESVKPLVHNAEQGVRVAAVQILLAVGQEDWLASQLSEM